MRAEQLGRDREVEHPHGLVAVRAVLEEAVQLVPVVGVGGVEGEVVEPAEHPGDGRLVEQVGGDVRRQGRAHLGAVALVVDGGARDADDPGVVGQVPLAVAEVEGRQELAEGQVTGAPEDREVTGLGQGRRGGGCGHASNGKESSD